MKIRMLGALGGGLFGFVVCFQCNAEIRPEKVRVADTKKTSAYIKEGLVTGGDRAIDGVVIRDIRRAPNGNYERIVVDLDGTHQGEPAPIARPPYFQIAVQPEFKRLLVSIWGKPRLAFQSKKVIEAFKKSQIVNQIILLPKVEEELWTFAIELKDTAPVEVFELADQARLILDVGKKKTGRL